jgi:hypothetical protein
MKTIALIIITLKTKRVAWKIFSGLRVAGGMYVECAEVILSLIFIDTIFSENPFSAPF